MDQVELVFAANDLPDETLQRIHKDLNAFTVSFGRMTEIAVTAAGPDVAGTAVAVVQSLEQIPGVRIERCCHNLMTLADVADRVGVTEDAVREWIQTVSSTVEPFPTPYDLVAGGVWLWGDVNAWLGATGRKSEAARHPSQDDILRINAWLASRSPSD